MADKKKPTKAEVLEAQIKAEHEQSLDDATGQLYNQFVAYIAEARIPIYNLMVVLDILKAEATEQIRKKQGLI